MEKEILDAKKELENWLSHPNELGQKPIKIEYTNHLEDEDGSHCFIFKYKKSLFGKWYLGIVSDSGTFSEMKEYRKETEMSDATEILEKLKNYWKEMAKKNEAVKNKENRESKG